MEYRNDEKQNKFRGLAIVQLIPRAREKSLRPYLDNRTQNQHKIYKACTLHRSIMDIYKLHKNEDKTWRSWIRASGKKLPEEFYQALVKTKKSENKDFTSIASNLGISYKMLQNWTTGKRAIPLWILKFFEEKTGLNLGDNIEFLKVYGSQDIKKPIINKEYIEVIGRHCGDGSCSFYNGTYRVNIKEDKSLLEQHREDLKSILGINAKINREQGTFLINVDSKVYYRIITVIFGIPSGNEKTYNVEEPSIIKILPINKRKYFLRGLIDTDGWIYYNKGNRSFMLGFKVVNEKLANSVYMIIKLLKIPVNKRLKGKYTQIEITGKENIKKYLQIVGSKNNRILCKLAL